ncbi:hypothetical protein VM1G_02564 [Cytospora mali]|uniref:Endonuclease/exonuclease/phosphatase domain-containing protein n=1 Tax=Cytospora mali TaxID=578113 RepID=A0A194VU22_CYTMA|nr:hypothetical protein VM1G_02564 [Valsa mali]
MSFISSLRTRYLSWSQSTPLPILSDASLAFQTWHTFDESAGGWTYLPTVHHELNATSSSAPTSPPPTLNLATWNVDAFGKNPEARMDGVLSQLRSLEQAPDIIFFQEVSQQALTFLLNNTWFRDRWISSEADETHWAGVQFATLTLLSRARFSTLGSSDTSTDLSAFSAGPVWRVKYPSRFRRDALCCDVFYYNTRIRLINVHLDSLPIKPNQRPRQVEIAANHIRHAGIGRGLIAGDFNPVSDEDAILVTENGLLDAWEALHPGQDGFTWGLDGSGAPFPPGRLDKIAMLGLKPRTIEIIHPGILISDPKVEEGKTLHESEQKGTTVAEEPVPCSDHSGLFSSFEVIDV